MKKIAIIGAGRVGTALGEAFKLAGYEIVGIVSRNYDHSKKLMKLTGCKYWTSNPQDVAKLSDIILISVSDSAIKLISNSLVPVISPETLLVHTSGALASSILGSRRALSMHPIASFVGNKLQKGTYFGIEGDIQDGKKLVKSIGGIPIIISHELKPLYHSGLNFGAAYILTLLNTGKKLLEISGIKDSEKVILSLASSTLHNAKKRGIKNSLTGPIQRGDIEIVEQELQGIKQFCPEMLEFYKILVRETEKLVNENE
jgi:predicted short-subunit dehydrogenase-like oxidoreductase (DUF2520 family)